jgi:hypothetical protein
MDRQTDPELLDAVSQIALGVPGVRSFEKLFVRKRQMCFDRIDSRKGVNNCSEVVARLGCSLEAVGLWSFLTIDELLRRLGGLSSPYHRRAAET